MRGANPFCTLAVGFRDKSRALGTHPAMAPCATLYIEAAPRVFARFAFMSRHGLERFLNLCHNAALAYHSQFTPKRSARAVRLDKHRSTVVQKVTPRTRERKRPGRRCRP